jgi:hypothetical protein
VFDLAGVDVQRALPDLGMDQTMSQRFEGAGLPAWRTARIRGPQQDMA